MPEQHAFLGASSAHRWLNCPPSARTCQNFPDTKSEYAAAGTLAHSIAELKARNYFLGGMTLKEFKRQLKELKAQPEYDKGMDAATDMYLDHLREVSLEFQSPPFVALETKVNYSHIMCYRLQKRCRRRCGRGEQPADDAVCPGCFAHI